MSSNQHANSKKQLSWQVPIEQRSWLRARVLRFAFSGLICLGVLLLFGSRSFRIAALAGAIPFALLVLWRTKRRSRQKSCESDNVRLDREGLHWWDSRGTERKIAREQIEGFRIGLDPDTMRALPALTLILVGGFESQPVELHTPVGPSHVRQFLVDHMHVDETRQDEEYAVRLHDALEVACESQRHLPEIRVLRCGLHIPERLADGAWSVAELVDGHQIAFLPDSCGYRCSRANSLVEVENVAALSQYIREEILANRNDEPREWLSRLDRQQVEREQLAVRRDASQLGFYVECDPHGRLHFEGSRGGILALCERMTNAAQQLRPAPMGARPVAIRVGGSAVRLELVLDEVPWNDESTIAGPCSYLSTLAEEIRLRIEDEVTVDLHVKVKHADYATQSFGVHLRGDDYDPLAEFTQKVASRQNA